MTGPLAGFLCPDGFAGPRGLRSLLAEATVVRELVHSDHLPWSRGRTSFSARVQDQPVLLIPGFLAGDLSLRPLTAWLRSLGHRTYRAQMLSNVTCTRSATDRLEQRVEAIATRRERPVALVGHSLGGLLARALASRRPDLVRGIVTLGSPLLAPGAVHTVLKLDLTVLGMLNRLGVDAVMSADCLGGTCAQRSWADLTAGWPVEMPFTSVFSARDGIVDWRSCLDPAAHHVEVRSSHMGMAVDRSVWREVATALNSMTTESELRATG
jgi:pimeloyl-ACP methyl ester carboxylesterase